MCTTNTSLRYGIIVRTWSLYIAAKAHPRIAPVALALDMIIQRAGNETLIRVAGGKVLTIEIWGMIRKEVYGVEIYNAELQELAFLNKGRADWSCQCGKEGCDSVDFQPRSAISSDASTLYSLDKTLMLLNGTNARYNRLFDSLADGHRTAEINQFLKLHGFSTTSAVRCYEYHISDLVSPISIDTQLDSGALFLESSHDNELGSTSAALIPTDLLSTPLITIQRFKKLFRDYRLDFAPNDSVPSFMKKIVKKSSGMVTAGKARLVVEPKWMLWSSTSSCN